VRTGRCLPGRRAAASGARRVHAVEPNGRRQACPPASAKLRQAESKSPRGGHATAVRASESLAGACPVGMIGHGHTFDPTRSCRGERESLRCDKARHGHRPSLIMMACPFPGHGVFGLLPARPGFPSLHRPGPASLAVRLGRPSPHSTVGAVTRPGSLSLSRRSGAQARPRHPSPSSGCSAAGPDRLLRRRPGPRTPDRRLQYEDWTDSDRWAIAPKP
jgi:hypothetical protein